jgi:hypothetical protein
LLSVVGLLTRHPLLGAVVLTTTRQMMAPEQSKQSKLSAVLIGCKTVRHHSGPIELDSVKVELGVLIGYPWDPQFTKSPIINKGVPSSLSAAAHLPHKICLFTCVGFT